MCQVVVWTHSIECDMSEICFTVSDTGRTYNESGQTRLRLYSLSSHTYENDKRA